MPLECHFAPIRNRSVDAESPDLPFSAFRFRERERFAYLYDMGDYWEHEVRLEKFLERDPKKTYPVCIGGSGACPPEDCGGPPGYLECRDEAMGLDTWSDMCSGLSTSAVVLENSGILGSDYLRMEPPLGSHYLRMSADYLRRAHPVENDVECPPGAA